MPKRVVVTGASGHIGYHVAAQLLELGVDVSVLIRKENTNISLLKNKGAISFIVDLLNPPSYAAHFKSIDAVFHIASENTTDTSDEERVIRNTFHLTKAVIDTAVQQHVPTIIYTSSVVVLGRSSDPDILLNESHKASVLESPYVKGKFLAEEYCNNIIAEGHADIRRLYPSWVVGRHDPRLTPPHKVIKGYLEKGQFFYFHGGISVASVEEVARAHINAWLIGGKNEKYVVAGNNVTFKEFYTAVSKQSKHRSPFVFLPKWIIYWGSLAAKGILGRKSPVDPRYIRSVVGNCSWYDSGKAISKLNYSIPSIDMMISDAVTELRRKALGLDGLIQKDNPALKRLDYGPDDILLVTGFPGWLGNRLLDILMNGDRFGNNAVNRRIRVLVQPGFKSLVSLPDSIEVFYGDITSKESLRPALEGVKAVYHLAGVIYPKSVRTHYDVNLEGTKNIVDICIEKGVRRILFMGTDSICGYGRTKRVFDEHTPPHPYKHYGKSKYLAEKYILDKTAQGLIDGTSLRGFWFFGPFLPERNMAFFKMFRWKRQVVFGNGKNLRSISHVDNVVQAFIKAEKSEKSVGKWYWIGSKSTDYTVDHIYAQIAEGMKVPYRPLYVPRWMCELFSLVDSAFGIFGKINATIQAAGKFHKDIAGEITAAERDFNFKPDVGFEEIKKELNAMN
jgi:dihydroflavonol-4-reductase